MEKTELAGFLDGIASTTFFGPDKDALRQAAAALRESEWRPIESAPKDGTPIIGMWRSIVIDGKDYGTDRCITLFKDGEWRNSHDYNDLFGEPSLWSPLPPPPAIDSARGAG